MKHRIWAITASLVLSGCALSPKNIKPSAPYNFALIDQMAKYAQGAYASETEIRALCAPAFDDVTVHTIATTDNQYFIATNHTTKTQLISIAGTANSENMLLDADFTQEMVPELHIALHRGFSRAARLIYDDVKPHLIAGFHVQITGHSLGGAEAVIVGMLFKVNGTPAESIITFGQPKVSNAQGVEAFKDLPLTRVLNQEDVIPDLPLPPYSHIGPDVVLFPGTRYSVVSMRPINPAAIAAAWQALRDHKAPDQLPQHYLVNYLANLESKMTTSELVSYQ